MGIFRRRRDVEATTELAAITAPQPTVVIEPQVRSLAQTRWMDELTETIRLTMGPRAMTDVEYRANCRAQVDAAMLFLIRRVASERALVALGGQAPHDTVACAANILRAKPWDLPTLRTEGRF